MSGNIKRNDNGVVLDCTIKENGNAVNLTSAKYVEIIINSRSRRFSKMSNIIDRVNGICRITLMSEDLNDIGNYNIQGIVTFNNGTEYSSDIESFYVENRLRSV